MMVTMLTSVAIQPDGKIVAGGCQLTAVVTIDFRISSATTRMARWTPALAQAARWPRLLVAASDVGTSAAIQSDGKIVVAGHTSSNGGYYDFALVRYAGTPPASANAAPSVPVPTLPTVLA